MVKKSLFLVTIFVAGSLIAGCAYLKDLSEPISSQWDKTNKTPPNSKRVDIKIKDYRTLAIPHPEDEYPKAKLLRAQREPDGFRGIKFGTDISTLEDMEFVEQRAIMGEWIMVGDEWKRTPPWLIKVYTRKNEIMQVGSVPLDSIEYFFSEGKFCCVELICKDPLHFSRLKSICEEQFGPSSSLGLFNEMGRIDVERIWGEPYWVGEKTIVVLEKGAVDAGESPMERTAAEAAKPATWAETGAMYKANVGFDPGRSATIKGPLMLRIMTKEAAEQLRYRIEIKEKREKGEF